MRKKWFMVVMIAAMIFATLTACQKEEEPVTKEPVEEIVVEKSLDTTNLECSLCEVEKVCGIYGAEGEEYVVCADCANEFVTAFEDTAERHVCGGCQEEKICAMYVVDENTYFVCIDDYEEFAYGMGIE